MTTTRLQILLCTHCPADPGTAVFRSVSARAERLRAAGHVVDVVTAEDLLPRRYARLYPALLPLLLTARKLSRYDVIVFHSYLGWAFHLFRGVLDPRRRVATVTSFHGLEPLYNRAVAEEYRRQGRRLSRRFRWVHHLLLPKVMRAICRDSDGVLCLNSEEAGYLTTEGWAEGSKVHQVSNGVEEDCFVPRASRPVARQLLFVGQWLPAKGTRYLIEAFESLAATRTIHLVCAGTGAPVDEVLLDFPPHVRPLVTVRPRVTRAELRAELEAADCFVFPSLYEGFGRALLEAMAAGLPTVTTSVGAALDLVDDGRNALLVPCADAAALAAATARLLDDAELRERLGHAARATAVQHTTATVCARIAAIVEHAGQCHSLSTSSPHARDAST